MATTWLETAGVTCTPKGCRQRQENMRQAVSGNAKRHVLVELDKTTNQQRNP